MRADNPTKVSYSSVSSAGLITLPLLYLLIVPFLSIPRGEILWGFFCLNGSVLTCLI